VVVESIIFYFTFRYIGTVPLDTIAVILSTLFALVFLLPQIIGQFVLKPHPQNLYELYPRKLHIIAFIYVLGIVISVSGITFEFEELPLDLCLSINNITFFLFLNSLGLLILHFNDTLANLSFDHNFRTLKENYISLIVLSQKENISLIQSFKEDCRYGLKNIYGLIRADLQSHMEKDLQSHMEKDLQSHMEKDLQSHMEKISTVIESLHMVDGCYIPRCIENIFEIIGNLLENNKSYMGLLDSIIKISYISRRYTIKKATIDSLSDINLKILSNYEYRENKNEFIKENIKEIAKIGSSNLDFNHDVLIIETQKKIEKIFNKCLERKLDEFDYRVFVYSLGKLLEKAFKNNIKHAIQENIEILSHIPILFKNENLSTNPTKIVIEKMRDIGIECAEKRWENLLFYCFNTILQLRGELSEKYQLELSSCALIIASYCNKYIPEVLARVEDILKDEIEDLEAVKAYALKYTDSYSQIHHSILEEYLNTSEFWQGHSLANRKNAKENTKKE
jgi:hypothetical protein